MKIEPFRCPNACRMEVSVTLRHYTQTCHQQRRRGNLESIPIKREREREREKAGKVKWNTLYTFGRRNR